MSRSDTDASHAKAIDWRGWLALAWVVWFGLLYGKMVYRQRSGKLASIVSSLKRSYGASDWYKAPPLPKR
jgi:hypothetical protein